MLCTLIGAIILSINVQVDLNMHLFDDIGDASSSLRGSTSSFRFFFFFLKFCLFTPNFSALSYLAIVFPVAIIFIPLQVSTASYPSSAGQTPSGMSLPSPRHGRADAWWPGLPRISRTNSRNFTNCPERKIKKK